MQPPSPQPLTPADSERLIAGQAVPPWAPAAQHALAGLLDSAAGPARERELTGEAAAVAAFRTTRHPRFRIRVPARRGAALAAALAAVVMAFSGAAAANALPTPIQELAHRTFGLPAPPRIARVHVRPGHETPRPPASAATTTTAPASPRSTPGKTTGAGKRNGAANGEAKGHATPPGQAKKAEKGLAGPCGRRDLHELARRTPPPHHGDGRSHAKGRRGLPATRSDG